MKLKCIGSLEAQALKVEQNLHQDPSFVENYEAEREAAIANGENFVPIRKREIVALIAYLQRLGTDIKVKDSQKVN